MERVLGIGGLFFRAKHPHALASWYEANLGICVYPATDEWWIQRGGSTVLAPFEHDTESTSLTSRGSATTTSANRSSGSTRRSPRTCTVKVIWFTPARSAAQASRAS